MEDYYSRSHRQLQRKGPLLLHLVFRAILTRRPSMIQRGKKKYNGPSGMHCREQESHARGAYPAQDTSRI